jgi:hypothetical protein
MLQTVKDVEERAHLSRLAMHCSCCCGLNAAQMEQDSSGVEQQVQPQQLLPDSCSLLLPTAAAAAAAVVCLPLSRVKSP